MTTVRETCPTCGATEKRPDFSVCSDGFHAPGETYWPVTDTMRGKIARAISDTLQKYGIAGPSLRAADAVLALIEPVMEENERYKKALQAIEFAAVEESEMWAGNLARAALSPESETQDG